MTFKNRGRKVKIRKWSFFIMLIIVSSIILVACSGDNEEVSVDKDNEQNNELEENEGEPEETYDLGGRTIKIDFHAGMEPEEGTELGDLAVERWKEVEEKYNVTIEWTETPYDQKFDKFTTTVLAGEPYADMVLFDQTEVGRVAALAQEELIIPYDDIIDLSQSKVPEEILETGRISTDGKVYKLDTLGAVQNGGGMFYNKTMFEQAGLEDPYELVQKGEWTWEAMLDAAKALTTGDQYGLAADPNNLAEKSIMSNDARILDVETGEVVMDDPDTIEALEFVADLYNVHGVVKPNDRSTNWEDPPVFFNEGLAAMVAGDTWESSEERQEAPFDWGYVYWPLGPNATEYAALKGGVSGHVIPVGVEDPEIVYQIWEDLQLWEYERESAIEWFEDIFPNQESVDIATQMLDNMKIAEWKPFDLDDAFYETFEPIANGEETPAQAVAKIKQEAQARVDEFLGK